WHGEFCNKRKDGSLYWEHASINPVQNDQGVVTHFIAIKEDISERREIMRKQEEARRAADAANRAKSDFLATMSHEIRTPMNAILGLAHLLGQTELTVEQHGYMAKLTSSGQSLLNIINDILDFSRIEAGRLAMEDIDYNLATVFDELATIMSVSAAAKNIETVLSLDPSLPLWLKGDPSRLRQVLVNLTGNAIKFTESGTVSLHARQAAGDSPSVRFSVLDTGIGMSPEQMEPLFRPFSQADHSTTRRFGGTGLGLAICKRLVKLMGGTIGVHSVLGQGSEFWFTIPLIEGEAPVPELPEKRLSNLSVLIVDDNAVAREALLATVRSLGWMGQMVASGQEALEHLADHAGYDVLLIDWQMPGMDGLETIRRLQKEWPGHRVPTMIMVTGFERELLQTVQISDLIAAILTKPLTPSALYEAMAHIDVESLGGNAKVTASGGNDERPLAGIRVLVVEDNFINQEVARKLLESGGAAVTVVQDGAQSLTWLQQGDVDVVLMDVQMPVMDGFEATRRIRQELNRADLPIIALSAGVFQNERERCLAAGMNDFIPKPIDVTALWQTIQRYTAPRPVGFRSRSLEDRDGRTPLSLPEMPGFDQQQALKRVGGDIATLMRLLRRMADDAGFNLGELRHFLAQGKTAAAAACIHKLRGGAGSLGLMSMAAIAARAEAAILNGPSEHIIPLVNELEQNLIDFSATMATIAPLEPSVTVPWEPIEEDKVQRLIALLADNNLEALDFYERMAPALAEYLGAERGTVLSNHMEKLEFVAARLLLEQGMDLVDAPLGDSGQ
ncbi:MAG: response regulator, partial [Magnetococcales bacterium]|nr:response regulator [Magnetococcales bacterium]